MLWLKHDYDKINKNPLLDSTEKWAILKQIIDKEAQTILSKGEGKFELYVELECIDMISDHTVKIKIYSLYNTDDKIRLYFRDEDLMLYKVDHLDDIIRELIYHLKVKFFGNEHLWQSSFVQVKKDCCSDEENT